MAALQDLIEQVDDPVLRQRIETEVDKLTKDKKFGLVFEEHLPECTPLYGIPIRVGSTVSCKTGYMNNIYSVLRINDDEAVCMQKETHEQKTFKLDEIVAIAEFGEPIYPYLQPVDSICNAPDDSLWHTLIEADNYHALQLLEYLYEGKVDCIYIDPPYNSGANDWKYNNDYVSESDSYRHSKWLSMMEKRLKIAKRLLRQTGVLIIAIDDYEMAHLKVLLESLFPEYDINTVIIKHHPQGGAADNISRTHEYALFLTPHGGKFIRGTKHEEIDDTWSLMRGGTDKRNLRKGRPNSFYAIFVDKQTYEIKGVGPHLEADEKYDIDDAPDGCFAKYPIGKDGTERVWRYERESMLQHINDGDIFCTPALSLKVAKHKAIKYDQVFSVWTESKYNAGTYGTDLLYDIFAEENRFPYAKSLYTVKDCLAFATQDNQDALIVDFFAGSGTTLHATNLLNTEDGGHRRCIMVTNNEVSSDETKSFTAQGYKPGDAEWEKYGIARYVTWPRTVCSIKGQNIDGDPLDDNYLGSDIPMSDGFKTNVAYFKLGFLDKTSVALGMQFKALLPVLWMKAGASGECPTLDAEELPSMMILPENGFAVLIKESGYHDFEKQMANYRDDIQTIYFVTDSEPAYRMMASEYMDKKTYQLYRDYLDNFRINIGR